MIARESLRPGSVLALGVVGQVDGDLGIERQEALLTGLPLDHGGEDLLLQFFLVADEVIIHDEDALPPAGRVDRLQFLHELGGRLGAGAPAVEKDDITELTIERTAP